MLPRELVLGLAVLVLCLACQTPTEEPLPGTSAEPEAHELLEVSEERLPGLLAGLGNDRLIALAAELRELGKERDRDDDSAATAYRAARAASNLADDPKGAALAEILLGRFHGRRGRYAASRPHLEKAVLSLRDLGDSKNLAIALNNLGIVLRNLGRPGDAVPLYREALALAESDTADGTPAVVAGRLHNLGTALEELGDLDAALEPLSRALEIKRRVGEPKAIYSTLVSLANVFEDRGETELAEESLREALTMAAAAGDPRIRIAAAHNLGGLLRRDGRLREARSQLEGALATAAEAQNPTEVLYISAALALVEIEDRKPQTALDRLESALGEFSESGSQRARVGLLLAQARALETLERFDEASAAAENAVRDAQRLAFPDLIWQAWHLLGSAREAAGNADDAAHAFRQAIDGVESWRRSQQPLSGRLSFLDQKIAPYHQLLSLEVDAGRGAEGLRVAENARARTLADLLDAPSNQVVSEQVASGQELVISEVPDGTAILAFTVTEENVRLWYRAGNGNGHWSTIALTEAVLAERVERFRRSLAERDLAFRDLATRLGADLLGQLPEPVRAAERWIVVPDGPLWDLPWAALELDGEPLVTRHLLNLVPSLRYLNNGPTVAVDGIATEGVAFVAGRDDEDGAVNEQAATLAALYEDRGVRLDLIRAARASQFPEILSRRPRLLHVAAHGTVEPSHPAFSFLQLVEEEAVPDGRLDARDLVQLDFSSVELTILAACESGRGRIRRGEGVLGLAWSVLAAGSRGAVISQWRVDAEATTELMAAFHRRLASETGKTDTAASLRDAMLELADGDHYAHPFYWAGFQLVGHGRLRVTATPLP